jgi:E3 ubiquitin-protein ligase HECTD2
MVYTLEDLAEYRPQVARGLAQLLEYDGDIESTFGLDFAVDVEKYGAVEHVPLCPGGDKRAVTNANRREYVDLYVRFLLETSVSRQFEPFKRGFFTVCGGNALQLFQPDEIELLVRGSDEALDVASLRLVAEYDGWHKPPQLESTVRWFWEIFETAAAARQRRLLLFVTGSDRIPATGATALRIRVVCHGDDCGRYPTARTCFNMLGLYRYKSKSSLEEMLWAAVDGSEGFGLK